MFTVYTKDGTLWATGKTLKQLAKKCGIISTDPIGYFSKLGCVLVKTS